ncbi:hypothetical protein Tco_0727024 [Tanacetum coccineum]|uniref:Uncharacterized protein n=1 Tax=Tanacetum coccineum TaxID=301880 RepID=A0ABQ4YH92_9ASTR
MWNVVECDPIVVRELLLGLQPCQSNPDSKCEMYTSFVIMLVGVVAAVHGWLDSLCCCFVNAWLTLCDFTMSYNLMYLLRSSLKGLFALWLDKLNKLAAVAMKILMLLCVRADHVLDKKRIMDTTRAHQQALDDELVAPADRLKIGKSNLRLSSTLKSKEPTIQVVLDALKLTPFYNAFEISADVPEIYMQEFWVTVTRHHSSLRFKLDGKSHTVNVDNFRDMLKICPKLPGQKFKEPLLEEDILSFVRDLRHTGEIKFLSDVNVNHMHLTLETFAGHKINKCLSGKELRSENLVFQVENKNSKKNNDMYYLRFTKVIVNYFMAKDQAILRRNKMFWNYARMTHVPPTTIRSFQNIETYKNKRCNSPSALYQSSHVESKLQDCTTKPTHASKGKIIKTSAKGDKSATTKSKGLIVLSAVALSEAEQMKLATTRSLKEFHISYASGSGDGVDILSKDEEEDEEHDSDDDNDDNDDKDDDQENDSQRTKSDDEGDDFKVSTPPDYELTEEDENQQDDDTMGEEQGDKDNGELYRDLNINFIDRFDVQKNLYKALLEAYNSNKDLLSSYGKEESSKEATQKKLKSTSSSKGTTRSPPKSSDKSVQEEEHDLRVDDLEEPFHQEFDIGNDDVSPVRAATDVDERLWNPSGSQTPDREWNQNIYDKIPRSTWSEAQVVYDKHAYWGYYHWGPKRQRFYGYATNMETSKDVYSKHRIIAVTSLKITGFFGYKHLEEITIQRQDDKLYKFREGDFKRLRRKDIKDMLLLLVQGKLTNLNVDERFALNVALRMYTRRIVIQERVEDLQLAVESYQKKINFTKPDTYRSDISKKTPYTAYHDIQSIIYQDDMNRNH